MKLSDDVIIFRQTATVCGNVCKDVVFTSILRPA